MNVPHYVLRNRYYELAVGFFSQLRGEKETTYRSGYPISVNADESPHLVEVHVSKLRLLNHLGVEPASEFHHQ